MNNNELEPREPHAYPELALNIITRQDHNISRQSISENALKVLYRLHGAGFEAYLVGGGVRDLLLGSTPKDFDIATNATPEQIRQLFRNCRLIGRRFRLAHIMFGRDIVEVATFRGHHQETNQHIAAQSEAGMLLRDNVYGTIDEDAERRDFTINAMYYNIADYSIHDYAGGMEDLEDKLVRLIGDPEVRYREDPVRMLRAIRFAVKLDFDIEEDTAAPIEQLAPLLRDIPSARLYEESLKMLQTGYGLETYHLMREYNLFQQLFPQIAEHFTEDDSSLTEQMLDLALDSTDIRIEEGKRINPAFMFAAFFWYPMIKLAEQIMETHQYNFYDAVMEASNKILDQVVKTIAIPRRHTTTIREIWQMQLRLPRRTGKRAFRLLELNKFRAGFDFLEMRGEIEGGEVKQLANWWQTFQNAGRNMRQAMVADLGSSTESHKAGPRRRKPSNRKRKPKGKTAS
ncbi:polynucleotide adenylyltransferase PcnB [Vibrio cincinnatiensis]|jgi:poly(A) polymerase|uniref:Poly(A) polymerase I n=1 Tax=Vibrio cincinnatiensis DSM 19608 TaxID=1123491 RepID=A0A1T4PBZ6_VIBCI|nr:polynucleotide adenylyltransferase PcnB [Vibrio cincinnatiensis]MCG3721728.1 polynucleotide adenylyltransferase PcnB [Vibrio cincinnatiensis]MCG3731468.1 polynucleotide adenylyltransferase PcnB [Vibrio cincinnatiensis]MCG3735150.1 polynucleotide adenylyltransferase PcnB [Vibrio cincinnatiensis]MCG3739163.1 polynucleotide adenylyltransferase PcnB [Vibrio cincinnatiensis]MCG3742547.1 polynucleotide adenylyltransferase PcnB [Vibrio cincinnatiensis]